MNHFLILMTCMSMLSGISKPVNEQINAQQVEAPANQVKLSESFYQNNCVAIQYPSVSRINDENLQKRINQILKTDALSIAKYYDEPACLSVRYKVTTLSPNLLSVVYTGEYVNKNGPYPVSLLYTSNIDLVHGKRIRFCDDHDASMVVRQLISGSLTPLSDNTELVSALNDSMQRMDPVGVAELKNVLEHADFEGGSNYPEAFSYFEEGNLILSIPVIHAFGDHAEYKITTNVN